MRKCCYDLLKKHSGDLLYKAPLPKREREGESERVVSTKAMVVIIAVEQYRTYILDIIIIIKATID